MFQADDPFRYGRTRVSVKIPSVEALGKALGHLAKAGQRAHNHMLTCSKLPRYGILSMMLRIILNNKTYITTLTSLSA